jgi:Tol biopolymer transport system component
LSYFAPTASPDGRVVYALGQSPHPGSELVRYDASQAVFTPFLSGLAARDVEFSRDGQWIAYVRHPEGTLWRSRRDGTETRQLTFPPLTAALPRWSPDGRRIAYMFQSPGEPWSSALVATEGGGSRSVGEPGWVDPSWPPEGERLLFGTMWDWTSQSAGALHVVDLRTGGASVVPGSQGLYSPRWSPDGRSIAALSAPANRLALHDLGSGRWRDLITGTDILGFPSWTSDGKWIQVTRGSAIVRVRASDGHVERVTGLERVAVVNIPWGWIGLADDDSPITLRAIGATEGYALDVEWP